MDIRLSQSIRTHNGEKNKKKKEKRQKYRHYRVAQRLKGNPTRVVDFGWWGSDMAPTRVHENA